MPLLRLDAVLSFITVPDARFRRPSCFFYIIVSSIYDTERPGRSTGVGVYVFKFVLPTRQREAVADNRMDSRLAEKPKRLPAGP